MGAQLHISRKGNSALQYPTAPLRSVAYTMHSMHASDVGSLGSWKLMRVQPNRRHKQARRLDWHMYRKSLP